MEKINSQSIFWLPVVYSRPVIVKVVFLKGFFCEKKQTFHQVLVVREEHKTWIHKQQI